MAAPKIDTSKVYKIFIATGMSGEEAHVEAVSVSASVENLVTKDDLEVVRAELKSEIKDLRIELKSEIKDLRIELKSDIKELKSDIKEVRGSVNKIFYTMIGAIIIFILKTVVMFCIHGR